MHPMLVPEGTQVEPVEWIRPMDTYPPMTFRILRIAMQNQLRVTVRMPETDAYVQAEVIKVDQLRESFRARYMSDKNGLAEADLHYRFLHSIDLSRLVWKPVIRSGNDLDDATSSLVEMMRANILVRTWTQGMVTSWIVGTVESVNTGEGTFVVHDWHDRHVVCRIAQYGVEALDNVVAPEDAPTVGEYYVLDVPEASEETEFKRCASTFELMAPTKIQCQRLESLGFSHPEHIAVVETSTQVVTLVWRDKPPQPQPLMIRFDRDLTEAEVEEIKARFMKGQTRA